MWENSVEPGPCSTPLTVEGTQVVVSQVHQVLQRGVELLQDTLWPGRSTLTPVFPTSQRPQQVDALPLRFGWVQQGHRELPQPRHWMAAVMYSRAQSQLPASEVAATFSCPESSPTSWERNNGRGQGSFLESQAVT